jgi:hypothetical protein
MARAGALPHHEKVDVALKTILRALDVPVPTMTDWLRDLAKADAGAVPAECVALACAASGN